MRKCGRLRMLPAWIGLRPLGARLAIGFSVLAVLASCGTTKSEESTTHFCGATFFNFQPGRLPAPQGAAQEGPPAGNQLPPPSTGFKAYRVLLRFGDCNHGSLVVADPVDGIVVNRLVLAHDGTVAVLGFTPVRETEMKAWKGGHLVGAATIAPNGALLPAG